MLRGYLNLIIGSLLAGTEAITETQADTELFGETLQETLQETVDIVKENPDLVKTWFNNLVTRLTDIALRLAIAIFFLLVGLKLINFVVRQISKSFDKGPMEKGVSTFLSSLIRYVLYFLLVMLLLSQFGVTTGSVVAVLGSAGLTLGLALQGSLANFAGGVLILLLKPFVIGDYIAAAGEAGTVTEITIFYTKLLTVDNKAVVIPNGTLSNVNITNVSNMEMRRVDIRVGVDYSSDLSKVKEVLLEVARSDEAVVEDEERPITVFAAELAESGVNMEMRAWVRNEDYWTAKWRMTENIKNAFDENGIIIPYPHVQIVTGQDDN